MRKIKVRVVQDEAAPIEKQVLAKAIVDLSEAAQRLSCSGLNRRAVITLLADATGQGRMAIGYVLNALEALAETYTK